MKKRIYYNMIFIMFVSMVLFSGLQIFIFYSLYDKGVKIEINNKLYLIVANINEKLTEDNNFSYLPLLDILDFNNRLTLINQEGIVLYDSLKNNTKKIFTNHSDREEFIDAQKNIVGRSIRYSETLGSYTYYQAVKLNDGNILRIAQGSKSIYGAFVGYLPQFALLLFIILIFMHLLLLKLSKRIIEPLRKLNFKNYNDKKLYDELVPFIRKIEKQKKDITKQVLYIEDAGNTVNYILNSMQEGLVLLDTNSNILSINKSALNLFELDEGIIGENVLQLNRSKIFLDTIENIFKDGIGDINDIILEINDKIYTVSFKFFSDKELVILFIENERK